MSGRLDKKVAVVTGGANGIGRACCERFAEEGADLVVADVLDGPGQETVAHLRSLGRRAVFIHADAASPDANEAVMQCAIDTLGRLDVVVAAAGVPSADYRSDGDVEARARQLAAGRDLTPAEALARADLDDWRRVLDINLTGTLLAIQSASRRMQSRGGGGSIITLASIAGKIPKGASPAYSVSKAGVWMLTKFASQALAPAGIRVNAIGPGYIETNQTAIIMALPGLVEQLVSQVPMGRMGTAREVANTALFLASDELSYTSGEMFHVDGGHYTE